MSRQILAIDIRNGLIAGVLLSTGLKAHTISACAHVTLDSENPEDADLGRALSQLLADMPCENASLVVALPAHKSIYRTLAIPFKELSKIRQVLPFELEPTLPLPVDNLVIGFQKKILGEQTQVLAAAIERQLLERYMALFSEHNLQPQLVVPGSFPAVLELIAHETQLPKQALVVDVDRDNTTLFALVAGHISIVRCLPADTDSESKVEHLALKIRQTLTAFADSMAMDFSPSSVFLHGPTLNNPDAVERLNAALGLPTQPMDLHTRMNKVEMADHIAFHPWLHGNALASACLLAEGNECPNFHRSSSTMRNFWAAYRPFIKTPAVLLAATLILGLGSVIYDNHILHEQLDGLERQMKQIFQSTFPGTSLSKAPVLAQMQSKLKEAQKNVAAPVQDSTRIRSIDALLEISQRLPSSIDVIIDRMVVSEDALTLSGETSGFNTVDDIKGRIEKSAFFKKVTIASANMDKSGKNVHFKLKIDL
jgi:general secretion pathway protein L